MSRYRFIEAQRDHYPVRLLCQLVAVPASGYYAWQQAQQPSAGQGQMEPAWETALVKAFGVHKRCYGTRRLRVELRRKGYRVGLSRWAIAATNGHAPTGLARAATQGLYAAHDRFDPWAALRA